MMIFLTKLCYPPLHTLYTFGVVSVNLIKPLQSIGQKRICHRIPFNAMGILPLT
jgi:hypothetical protein